MSTVSLPPGGAGGRIPTTRKGSMAMRQLPRLTMSPRSSASSSAHPSSPPTTGPVRSTSFGLGSIPVAESPVSEPGDLRSASALSLAIEHSTSVTQRPVPIAPLPALPSAEAPEPGDAGALALDGGNALAFAGNTLSRKNTSGSNVVLPRATPKLETTPFAPQDLSDLKYRRKVFYPADAEETIIKHVARGQTKFKRPGIPYQWTAYECPEGKLYFYDETRRVLTMTDIQDNDNLKKIEQAAQELLPQLKEISIPDDAELVLEKTNRTGTDQEVIAYYVATMSAQCIVWLEDVDVTYVTDGERAVVSETHLEKAVRAQFWQHVEMFPNHRGLPLVAINDLRDTFTYGLCDYVTSQTSMFAYDPDTIEKLAKCMAAMKDKERFLHFHGEVGARLDRKDSAFRADIKRPRSFAFLCISPLLFFMPFVYLKELEKTYVDNSVHYYFWRQFIEGLKRDWENSITPATVLLSANVGFLAINSIDTDSPNKSAAQIASYISSMLSLFIYIVAQILSRHHRHHSNGQADQALQYILKREDRLIGLQGVAIAFSLPTALFLWSMITFLIALLFVFFERTSIATRIAMGVVTGSLGLMVLLLLYLESEGTVVETSTQLPKVLRLLGDKLRTLRERCSSKNPGGDRIPRFGRRIKHVQHDSDVSSITLVDGLPGP
ncbi:hypothetical protein PsYK624_109600 [Phanerochaete sordida]|uniref:WW domain-containing protein n=1 Tax=Phanerochaete sordida TaxID=48140 RepID=A0A9P3GH00_9APHY|nr:hypothetical protein PsYK624_109600 [Phanerochaete sordida]